MLISSTQTQNTQQCLFAHLLNMLRGWGIFHRHKTCQLIIVSPKETSCYMEPCPPQAGTEVADLLLKCHQIEKELAASADLSVDEFHCLSQLFMHAPCCVKELCEFLGVHPTRASRLLNDLEKRGFVARALGFPDKRREHLSLTPEGMAAARSLLQSSTQKVSHLAAVLPSEALRLLTSSLGSQESGSQAT